MRKLRLSSTFAPIISIIIIVVIYIFAVNVFQPEKIYPTHVHKTLFLDRYLDADEVAFITEAAKEWGASTKNKVQFDVVTLPGENVQISDNDIMVMSMSPDHPLILLLDENNKYSTLGHYDDSMPIPIVYLVSERIKDKEYKTVVLHELGHALGLEHNESLFAIGTLMFPDMNFCANKITLYDLKNFCKLYHCNANELKN